ncbi:MAG TPA: hypothetical protein VIQ24_22700 [Pyrinomonadaceae bacterium]
MSDPNRGPVAGTRLLLIVVSLVLLTAIVGSLTVWSALARPQGLEDAALSTAHTTHAPPVASPPLDQAARHIAFIISWERTETSAGGHSRLLHTTTRYQRSDGLYKLVQTYPAREGDAGRVVNYFGYLGLGLFRLDEKRQRLVFVVPQSYERSAVVESALRADPRFDREEDVRGQRALVMRTVEADEAAYTEEFHAPALGGLLVRRVEHSPIRREVWEPSNIEFGEPAASLFADIDRYRPDYTHYEREIQKRQREPQLRHLAQTMRELMARMRAVRPDGH